MMKKRILQLVLVASVTLSIVSCTDEMPELITGEPIKGTPLPPSTEEPGPDPTGPIVTSIFDNAEVLDGWGQAGTSALNTDKKEGASSIKFTILANKDLRMQKKHERGINTQLTKETAQLNFWLWIEDASKLDLSTGQVEITSSGVPDQQEYNWPTTSLSLVSGWNEVKLKVSKAGTSGGEADLSAINFFRMYFKTKEDATADAPFSVAVDNIHFVEAEAETDPEPVPADNFLWDNCDQTAGWARAGAGTITSNTTDKKEGAAAVHFNFTGGITKGGAFDFKKVFSTPINPGITIENGILKFWLYIADVSKIDWNEPRGAQVEISSDGKSDSFELHWDVKKHLATSANGWNEISLNLSDANQQGGAIDLTKINYFKLYFRTMADITADNTITIGIDHLRFDKKP